MLLTFVVCPAPVLLYVCLLTNNIITNIIIIITRHCAVLFTRGSVIARIIGANVKDHPDSFHNQVQMYVYEELIDGKKLTEIINSEHENVKYLKGHKLPENIVSFHAWPRLL